jgi:hypothetical protein
LEVQQTAGPWVYQIPVSATAVIDPLNLKGGSQSVPVFRSLNSNDSTWPIPLKNSPGNSAAIT